MLVIERHGSLNVYPVDQAVFSLLLDGKYSSGGEHFQFGHQHACHAALHCFLDKFYANRHS